MAKSPYEPHGYSGVATPSSPAGGTRTAQEAKEDPFAPVILALREILNDIRASQRIRETSLDVLEFNTNGANADGGDDVTQAQGVTINCVKRYGAPAHSLYVQSVGGGTLQFRIGAGKWLPVDAKDSFDNMTIGMLGIRVTAAAAGTARFAIGYYAGE